MACFYPEGTDFPESVLDKHSYESIQRTVFSAQLQFEDGRTGYQARIRYGITTGSMVCRANPVFWNTHTEFTLGLIRYGIVIHGFIDGYSRLITGLRASNNNRAETVLQLFLDGAIAYGIPSRIRGDHGVENIHVAAWIEAYYSDQRRGSYIWGRSANANLILGFMTGLKCLH